MDASSDHASGPPFVITALEHAEERVERNRVRRRRDALLTAARLLRLQRRLASSHTN